MEYTEVKLEERIETARNAVKNFEQQHSGFVQDLARHERLINELDSGKWKHWDTRLRTQRGDEWRIQAKNARANIDAAETMILFARETLADLEAEQAATAENEAVIGEG